MENWWILALQITFIGRGLTRKNIWEKIHLLNQDSLYATLVGQIMVSKFIRNCDKFWLHITYLTWFHAFKMDHPVFML